MKHGGAGKARTDPLGEELKHPSPGVLLFQFDCILNLMHLLSCTGFVNLYRPHARLELRQNFR